MAQESHFKRAVQMLELAAEYIEEFWPDGRIKYDDTVCDGYCLADDCRSAAEDIEIELEKEDERLD